MIYYQEEKLIIRSMIKEDCEKFVEVFKAQGWHKPYELFSKYYNEQEEDMRKVMVAEVEEEVAGYVTLLPEATSGPFAYQGIPEVVDFNVLIKYQRRGIGNKLLDVTEALAKKRSNRVSLAVGLHSGYGPAQRMYVKRGYIPDGTGIWYDSKPLKPYTTCENNDSLELYLLKSLNESLRS